MHVGSSKTYTLRRAADASLLLLLTSAARCGSGFRVNLSLLCIATFAGCLSNSSGDREGSAATAPAAKPSKVHEAAAALPLAAARERPAAAAAAGHRLLLLLLPLALVPLNTLLVLPLDGCCCCCRMCSEPRLALLLLLLSLLLLLLLPIVAGPDQVTEVSSLVVLLPSADACGHQTQQSIHSNISK
jgi:hypothetical protein